PPADAAGEVERASSSMGGTGCTSRGDFSLAVRGSLGAVLIADQTRGFYSSIESAVLKHSDVCGLTEVCPKDTARQGRHLWRSGAGGGISRRSPASGVGAAGCERIAVAPRGGSARQNPAAGRSWIGAATAAAIRRRGISRRG